MPRMWCRFVLIMAVASGFTPLPVAAVHASGAPALTVDQVTGVLVSHGYRVGEPGEWTGGATMLSVYDGRTDRLGWPALRVFVYANSEQRLARAELSGVVTRNFYQGMVRAPGARTWRW